MHATLAESLRRLGQQVVVMSDGDGWRNYRRDIDITRRDSSSKIDGIRLICKLLWLLPRLHGFDVVQVINPKFLHLKALAIPTSYQPKHLVRLLWHGFDSATPSERRLP